MAAKISAVNPQSETVKALPAMEVTIRPGADPTLTLGPIDKKYDKVDIFVGASPRQVAKLFTTDPDGDSNVFNAYRFIADNRPLQAAEIRPAIRRFVQQWNAEEARLAALTPVAVEAAA